MRLVIKAGNHPAAPKMASFFLPAWILKDQNIEAPNSKVLYFLGLDLKRSLREKNSLILLQSPAQGLEITMKIPRLTMKLQRMSKIFELPCGHTPVHWLHAYSITQY